MPSGVSRYSEQLLRMIMERFREGLVFKAHGLVYHSTLGSRVIKEKKKSSCKAQRAKQVRYFCS